MSRRSRRCGATAPRSRKWMCTTRWIASSRWAHALAPLVPCFRFLCCRRRCRCCCAAAAAASVPPPLTFHASAPRPHHVPQGIRRPSLPDSFAVKDNLALHEVRRAGIAGDGWGVVTGSLRGVENTSRPVPQHLCPTPGSPCQPPLHPPARARPPCNLASPLRNVAADWHGHCGDAAAPRVRPH